VPFAGDSGKVDAGPDEHDLRIDELVDVHVAALTAFVQRAHGLEVLLGHLGGVSRQGPMQRRHP